MLRLAVAAALGALAFSAAAQTAATPMPPGTVAFVAVDAVRIEDARLVVTGLAQGLSGTVELSFQFTAGSGFDLGVPAREACERFALLAMAKPGQYTFEIAPQASGTSNPRCRLSRVAP